MTCDVCKTNEASASAIIDGKYYKNICQSDKLMLQAGQAVSSGAARWARDIDAEDHEIDMQQPYSNGKPNPKFIAAYPEQAKNLFSETEMRNAVK